MFLHASVNLSTGGRHTCRACLPAMHTPAMHTPCHLCPPAMHAPPPHMPPATHTPCQACPPPHTPSLPRMPPMPCMPTATHAPPPPCTHPHYIVNEWAVCILLECILVFILEFYITQRTNDHFTWGGIRPSQK